MAFLSFLRRDPERRLILLSNREPYEHHRGPGGRVRVSRPAGGLTAALIPVMAAAGGTWIAWGSGDADFDGTDTDGRLLVPPESPGFILRRIRLSKKEERQYYLEASNRGLWPLCHLQLNHFVYDPAAWKTYAEVNRRFATAAREEAAGRPATVWVQDYHLGLVPVMLRKNRGMFVHQFWHIPWPPPDVLRLLPSARQLLRGLLGNHLLEFQIRRHVLNFLHCVADLLPEARVSLRKKEVTWQGRKTAVRAHPISIDVKAIERLAARGDVRLAAQELRKTHTPSRGQLILGVDRVDYTKGIPHRLEAFDRLLEEHPEVRGRVALVLIAVPSRTDIRSYSELESEILSLAEGINSRFGTRHWAPVTILQKNLDLKTLVAWYRAADICVVSSVQDGMNLVAKEFVCAQKGRLGVLLLSEFTGAAEELKGAIRINPFDGAALKRALLRALSMEPYERERRLARMRKQVVGNTIHDWLEAISDDVMSLRNRA